MKYFLDTEFHEFAYRLAGNDFPSNTIELISIGIVAEDGREFYAVSKDFDVERALDNNWLRENVLAPILFEIRDKHLTCEHGTFDFQLGSKEYKQRNMRVKATLDLFGFTQKAIKEKIVEFIGDDPKPEFYAYYADYDWVVFCWLFGRMIDLPKNFPMLCLDLKQMMIERGIKKDFVDSVVPKNENEHNALADARWNFELYKELKKFW